MSYAIQLSGSPEAIDFVHWVFYPAADQASIIVVEQIVVDDSRVIGSLMIPTFSSALVPDNVSRAPGPMSSFDKLE